MHIVTVVNRNDPGLELWQFTAEKFNHNYKILYAPKHSKLGHDAGGWFGQKFVTLAEHLRTVHPDEICIFTDGFDVIFIQDAVTIETKIKSLIDIDKQLLFSAELYENPDQGNPYVTEGKIFPYLNSGIYAGKASLILQVLKEALDSDRVLELDDQRFYTQYMFKHPGSIVLDTDAKVFTCLAGFKDFQIINKQLYINPTKQEPGIIHFQGYFKNTLGVVPYIFPSEKKAIYLASRMHRTQNMWTPLGDILVSIGKIFPFGNRNPFLVGLVVVILFVLSIVLQVYIGNKKCYKVD